MRKIGKVLAYDEKTGKIVDDKLKTYIFTSEDILGDVKVNDVVLFSPEVYRTIEVTDKSTINKPLYGNVCYASSKTRKVISEGSTKYK